MASRKSLSKLLLLFPNGFVRIFMNPTSAVLAAPGIIRTYGLSFLLPLNVFSTYYFQAIMKPAISFEVSVGRGALISGLLILLLPVLAGPDTLWLAMPLTELITAVFVIFSMIRCTRQLPGLNPGL